MTATESDPSSAYGEKSAWLGESSAFIELGTGNIIELVGVEAMELAMILDHGFEVL